MLGAGGQSSGGTAVSGRDPMGLLNISKRGSAVATSRDGEEWNEIIACPELRLAQLVSHDVGETDPVAEYTRCRQMCLSEASPRTSAYLRL